VSGNLVFALAEVLQYRSKLMMGLMNPYKTSLSLDSVIWFEVRIALFPGRS
jgi:hypothetical protein